MQCSLLSSGSCTCCTRGQGILCFTGSTAGSWCAHVANQGCTDVIYWHCTAAALDCCRLCLCYGPCSAILLPIVVTFYVTYHFLQLFDGIFSVRPLLETGSLSSHTMCMSDPNDAPTNKPAGGPNHMLLSQASAGGLSWAATK